jgi:hypothetical protein
MKTQLFLLLLIALLIGNVCAKSCAGYKKICWGSTKAEVRSALQSSLRVIYGEDSAVFNGSEALFLAGGKGEAVLLPMLDIPDGYSTSSYISDSSFERYEAKEKDLVFFFKGKFFGYKTELEDDYSVVQDALVKKYGTGTSFHKDYMDGADTNGADVTVWIADGTRIVHFEKYVFYFDEKTFNKIKKIIDAKVQDSKKQQDEEDRKDNQKKKEKLDNL